MPDPFPFDALLFDLDGTLLATDRFWIPAATAGARRAFAELGIERELPSGSQWMSLVGLPLALGFDALFSDLTPEQRSVVRARCVEEEHFAIDQGRAALLPGVLETLEELRRLGVKTGVASNCSQAYLDAAMSKLALGELIDESRCLQSPGVSTKADMIQDLLWTFETRSAVFVGDRAPDRDAAHANALPHVHLSSGFAPPEERVECEATIAHMGELLPRLAERSGWILSALEALDCLGPRPPRALGISGPPGAGKAQFARDAARILIARGIEAAVRPARELRHLDRRRGISLLVGSELLTPGPRAHLDRILHLDASDETCLARLRARHLPRGEGRRYAEYRDRELPRARAILREHDPRRLADITLSSANTLGPERGR